MRLYSKIMHKALQSNCQMKNKHQPEDEQEKVSVTVTLRMPIWEKGILEAYCLRTGRRQTEVIREFVRTLEYLDHREERQSWPNG